MAHAQVLVSRLALTELGESHAKGAGLRGAIRSLINCLTVGPELPAVEKYLNAL